MCVTPAWKLCSFQAGRRTFPILAPTATSIPILFFTPTAFAHDEFRLKQNQRRVSIRRTSG